VPNSKGSRIAPIPVAASRPPKGGRSNRSLGLPRANCKPFVRPRMVRPTRVPKPSLPPFTVSVRANWSHPTGKVKLSRTVSLPPITAFGVNGHGLRDVRKAIAKLTGRPMAIGEEKVVKATLNNLPSNIRKDIGGSVTVTSTGVDLVDELACINSSVEGIRATLWP
jgi:hypothetical protein